MKLLRSPWIRLALFGLVCFLLLLALQIPWDRSYRTASGVPRSYAPFGDEIRRSDGSVDYRDTLNRLMGEKLPPEKNAVSTYAIYVARGDLRDQELRGVLFRAIGLSEDEYAAGQPFYEEYRQAEKSCQDASTYIWKSDRDYPEMAQWLDRYSNEITKLREASRYQWYCPLINTDPAALLVDDQLLIATSARHTARMLLCDSYREAGRGNFDLAVADVVAVYQTGLRVASQNCIQEVAAMAVRGIGLHAAGKLLRHERLNEAQLQVLRDCFQDGGETSFFQPAKMRSERYTSLEILQQIERQELPSTALGDLTQADNFGRFTFSLGYGTFVDRGSLLQALNQNFDSLSQCREFTKLQGSALWERLSLLDSEARRISGVEKGSRQSSSYASYWAGMLFSPSERGKRIGEAVSGMVLPAFKGLAQSEIRLSQQRGLLQLAFALEQYERRYGVHPDSLEQLVPEFLPALPIDHFAESGTFGYQKLEQGFRLSVGQVIPMPKPSQLQVPLEFLLDRSEIRPVELKK